MADETVAHLRLLSSRHPHDARLSGLVAELVEGSAAFRERWRGHAVRDKTAGRKRILHPEAGLLVLRFETFAVTSADGQYVVTYLAEDAGTAAGLARLERLRAVA